MAIMTVGNREVVFLATFIVPDNEKATFPVNFTLGVSGAPVQLTLSITFLSAEEGAEPRIEWRSESDSLSIICKGLRSPIGGATPKPLKLGEISGMPIGISLFSHWTSGVNTVTLQIMMGGTYE